MGNFNIGVTIMSKVGYLLNTRDFFSAWLVHGLEPYGLIFRIVSFAEFDYHENQLLGYALPVIIGVPISYGALF